MIRLAHPVSALLAVCCGVFFLAGCLPAPQSQLDEEKEYHFLAGKSRHSAFDYRGAIECYERALEVNPRSAAAHFELALLFEQKEIDHAAAIYHYNRYLKLRPNGEKRDIVKERINYCRTELAKTATFSPVTATLQKELEATATENRALKAELETLKTRLESIENASGVHPTTGAPRPQPVLTVSPPTGSGVSVSVMTDPRRTPQASASGTTPAAGSGAVRTHVVKSGETATMIARKYGVKLDALLAANPRVEAKRLRIGASLVIPPGS